MDESLERRIATAVREQIDIVAYDDDWPRQFEAEARSLRERLPHRALGRVEHFGSTAVAGLAAKPVIDILAELGSGADALATVVARLEADGYDYFWRTDCSPPYAWFIKRDALGRRTHHIHLIEAHSHLWERLLFRDYLREHPREARDYEELKRRLAEQHPHDRVAYTQGKTDYIVAATQRARVYYGAT